MRDTDSRLELEEVKDLERQFTKDLEAVFEEKAEEFGPHLRGLLLELWTRARDVHPQIIKEVESLRKLREQHKTLEQTVTDVLEGMLPAITQQLRHASENVLNTNLEGYLVSALEMPVNCSGIDQALTTALERVLWVEGLELDNEYDNLRLRAPSIESSALPELTDPTAYDKTQDVLLQRLKAAGVLPPDEFPESWKWAPVFFNTQTGAQAAFHYDSWQQRYMAQKPREMYLAWSGTEWRFPNPRPQVVTPNDDTELGDRILFVVDEVPQDRWDYITWSWTFEENQLVGVDIPNANPTSTVIAFVTPLPEVVP